MEDADDFEVPPPAYEFCQQEFDQKLHHALEASQNDQQQTHTADGDEFEVWDEAVFAAAAAQLSLAESSVPDISLIPESTLAEGSRAGGSSLTGIQPLRITKKRSVKPKSAKAKERPSWYTEAQLEEDPITATAVPTPAAPVPTPIPTAEPSSPVYNTPSSPEVAPSSSTSGVRLSMERSPSTRRTPEREPTPPPEFTEVGPDLNGPPYEPYDDPEPRASEVVLTYVPGDSNPPSPLASPTMPSRYEPFSLDVPPISIAPPSHRRALPRLPSQSTSTLQASIPYVPTVVPPRPSPSPNRVVYQTSTATSSIALKPHYGHTRLSFDPQMAYNSGRSQHHHHASEDLPRKADAAAFYTSAVSAVYTGGRGVTSQNPTQNSNTAYAKPIVPQVPLMAPQPRTPLPPHSLHAYVTGRTSPAPSIQSMQSNLSQDYISNRYSTYQGSTPVATGHQTNAYQPTTYEPTSYRPATQQFNAFQSTSYQPTAYQPTTYSNGGRRWQN